MGRNEEDEHVRCWIYDVSELADDAFFGKAMALLPWDARRSRVLRYRFDKDRRLCLGAGLLAAHALREAGASDLTMGHGAHGKPYLLHHPHLHFNLSHSGTLALCAVSKEPVGADVELWHPYDAAVADLCFTDAERRWIRERSDSTAAFTRIWVRKESYLKLLGTGLTDDVRSGDVTPVDGGGGEGPANVCSHGVRFWELEHAGHAIALCWRGDRVCPPAKPCIVHSLADGTEGGC